MDYDNAQDMKGTMTPQLIINHHLYPQNISGCAYKPLKTIKLIL